MMTENALPPIPYSDDFLRGILNQVHTIAIVGISSNRNRPSNVVGRYLQGKGYRVIPVNPTLDGQELLGERCYKDLQSIPFPVDMVDMFRKPSDTGPLVDDAIAIGARVIWMQLGVRNPEAGKRAETAGLQVVMDRCPKIEFSRLGGEIGWSGVATGVISNRALAPPRPPRSRPNSGQQDEPRSFGFATKAIHAGGAPDASTGARITPIYQTASYVFNDVDHAASLFDLQAFGGIYSRMTNPTVSVLEGRLATLEGGRAAVGAASGHAAQFLAFFTLLEPGDHFVASRNLYGGSLTQFGISFKRLGWHCTFVDPSDPENFRTAIGPQTKAIFLEALANPGGMILDVEPIAKIAHEAGIPLIVDNTLATPYLFRPFEWGADIVIHSTTKFLGGHGNSMGGVVIESGRFNWAGGKFPALTTPDASYHGINFYETFGDFAFSTKARAVALRDFGPALAPMNAFLTLTGVETLHLRMQRHCENAIKVAEFLNTHPDVTHVSYAGLAESPFKALQKKYMPLGAGAVFTFGLKGGYEAGCKVVEGVRLFSHLANIGDTRSLILHPASTTHRQLSPEQQIAAGAGPDTVRLSIGLEDAEDLIADLAQAIKAAR